MDFPSVHSYEFHRQNINIRHGPGWDGTVVLLLPRAALNRSTRVNSEISHENSMSVLTMDGRWGDWRGALTKGWIPLIGCSNPPKKIEKSNSSKIVDKYCSIFSGFYKSHWATSYIYIFYICLYVYMVIDRDYRDLVCERHLWQCDRRDYIVRS